MALKSVSKADPNYVPNYQLAAIPYVTSSAANEVLDGAGLQIQLPYVTKTVKVKNTGAAGLRMGFTEFGVEALETKNYFVIPTEASAGFASVQEFDVRCKSLWFAGDGGTTSFSLFAGLTPVEAESFPILTGSSGFNGVG
jgi:hypothetical protein